MYSSALAVVQRQDWEVRQLRRPSGADLLARKTSLPAKHAGRARRRHSKRPRVDSRVDDKQGGASFFVSKSDCSYAAPGRRSMRHQATNRAVGQQLSCHTTKHPFPETAMSVGADDKQVGVLVSCSRDQLGCT